jgi:hypothetical protein
MRNGAKEGGMESGWVGSAATAPSALGEQEVKGSGRKEAVRNRSYCRNTRNHLLQLRHENEGENDDDEGVEVEGDERGGRGAERAGREEAIDVWWGDGKVCALRPSSYDALDDDDEADEAKKWKRMRGNAERVDHDVVVDRLHRQSHRALLLFLVVLDSDVVVVVDVVVVAYVVRDEATARGNGDGRTWFKRSPAPPEHRCR